MHLEELGLLDMEYHVHRICLFLVFQARIQSSLDRARDAWNHHKLRTERSKTPIAIFELSRQFAITRGYWSGDPGDDVEDAEDPLYGYDGDAQMPPPEELRDEDQDEGVENADAQSEYDAGVLVNQDEELQECLEIMHGFDFDRDDKNWGIDVYCEAVVLLQARLDVVDND